MDLVRDAGPLKADGWRDFNVEGGRDGREMDFV